MASASTQERPRGAPAIEIRDVRFAYPAGAGGGGFALRVDSLDVARGERVACIGPSGSGKTTLVELIAGIKTPDSGSVRVEGRLISGLSEAERRAWRLARVGLVFQELELLEYLPALENVLLPYHLGAALGAGGVRARAAGLAAEAGVAHALRRLPSRLSQGERQRVAVCRALVTEPALLLCDEPTANLDPKTAAATLDLCFAHAERAGATLFFATHDRGLLPRFDRVVDVSELAGSG